MQQPGFGANEFRGIALLDTVHKLISSCINSRAQTAINYHNGIPSGWFRGANGHDEMGPIDIVTVRPRSFWDDDSYGKTRKAKLLT
jgi:hypothetical protein